MAACLWLPRSSSSQDGLLLPCSSSRAAPVLRRFLVSPGCRLSSEAERFRLPRPWLEEPGLHGQRWQRPQVAPSLQPLFFQWYLHGAAQLPGWPLEPAEGTLSSPVGGARNSACPCAKRHCSPARHLPFSFQMQSVFLKKRSVERSSASPWAKLQSLSSHLPSTKAVQIRVFRRSGALWTSSGACANAQSAPKWHSPRSKCWHILVLRNCFRRQERFTAFSPPPGPAVGAMAPLRAATAGASD
mmetsp:Transcript_22882/g.72000  ORF Transcript_22882/g.72000 Transcript_22882/m.72000 type:complete len:243 (+) Transcript_22882:410-1138(+)